MADTKDALTALYERWMTAVKQNDMETLDAIISPEYMYTGSGQGRWTRQDWMAKVPTYDIRSFQLVAIDVLEYGDVAVALTKCHQEAVVDGQSRSGHFLITDTWVSRVGGWQVVARSSILA